jgi:hypothetical protein
MKQFQLPREIFSQIQYLAVLLSLIEDIFIFSTAHFCFPALAAKYSCLLASCHTLILTIVLLTITKHAFRQDSFFTGAWFGVIIFLLLIVLGYLGCFTICYESFGLRTADGKSIHGMAESFYFAVTTWSTIGLGDIIPTKTSRVVVIVEALFSYFTTAVALGLAVHVTSKIYPRTYDLQANQRDDV